jgi:glycosyltransferase involved in cell wall biosynthesis
MRISIVSGTFHPDAGGPPTYLLGLAAALLASGHAVRVTTYGEPDPPRRFSYRVTRVSRRQPVPFRLLGLTWHVLRDAAGADVIFANDYGIPPMLANLFLHKPLVMKVVSDFAWEFGIRHGLVPESTTMVSFQSARYSPRLEAIRRLQRLYARRADAVIVPSEFLKSIVVGWGVPPRRVRVIYNAVDLSGGSPNADRLDLPPDRPIILTVARLVPWKGVDVLLRSFSKLRAAGSQALLVIVGDGEERPSLERLAADFGLAGDVRFVGEVAHDQVMAFLHRATVFALASSYEGFSHVLLEALSANLPVVATDVGGNPEAIESGVNGLLVPSGDAGALAEAIGRILDDDVLRERLKVGARDSVARFSWDRLYARTEVLFHEVAARQERSLSG